jgi:hypothetical protein
VIKDSDSTEELQIGPGWASNRSGTDDDLGYDLQDLGPRADGHDGKNYTIVVSAGRSGTLSDSDAQHDAGFGRGIKATTMITQEVVSDDSGESRPRGSR